MGRFVLRYSSRHRKLLRVGELTSLIFQKQQITLALKMSVTEPVVLDWWCGRNPSFSASAGRWRLRDLESPFQCWLMRRRMPAGSAEGPAGRAGVWQCCGSSGKLCSPALQQTPATHSQFLPSVFCLANLKKEIQDAEERESKSRIHPWGKDREPCGARGAGWLPPECARPGLGALGSALLVHTYARQGLGAHGCRWPALQPPSRSVPLQFCHSS